MSEINVVYSGGKNRKIREFYCQNEDCEVHQWKVLWEAFIFDEEREDEICLVCGNKAAEHIGTSHGWVVCKDRTAQQLKKRSKEHMQWCIKKGIHPNDTGYSPGPREWVNKTRSKNKSKTTIDRWKNAHKKWDSGFHSL